LSIRRRPVEGGLFPLVNETETKTGAGGHPSASEVSDQVPTTPEALEFGQLPETETLDLARAGSIGMGWTEATDPDSDDAPSDGGPQTQAYFRPGDSGGETEVGNLWTPEQNDEFHHIEIEKPQIPQAFFAPPATPDEADYVVAATSSVGDPLAPHHMLCPCCGANDSSALDGFWDAPSAPTSAGTLRQMADYQTGGWWSDTYSWGSRWFNMSSSGTQAKNGVLHYNLTNTPTISTQFGNEADSNGVAAALRPAIRDALDIYEEVLGINFVETTSTTIGHVDLWFADDESGNYATNLPASGNSGIISHSYINLPGSSSGPGDNYFTTILHEIGHALGLGHQGDYNGGGQSYANDAVFTNDSDQLAVMSYWNQSQNPNVNASLASPITLQTVDLLALNDLYGGQGFGYSNAFNGNTIYGVGTNITAATSAAYAGLAGFADTETFTIVDGSGIDTIDFSNYSANQRIDLRAPGTGSTTGSVSDVGGLTGNMLISVGTVIENATLGAGNDTIIGNSANNLLIGGSGNDSLVGNGGNDTLEGGAGDDTQRGGAGNDTFRYTNGVGADNGEYIYGDADTDRILVTGSNGVVFDFQGIQINSIEEIEFSADGTNVDKTVIFQSQEFDQSHEFASNLLIDGNNTSGSQDIVRIVMNTGNLDISGWTFQDWGGQSERVEVIGTSGANNITTTSNRDSVTAGSGDDTITGGAGNDTLRGEAGGDSLYGDEGNDSIYGGTGNDYIDGGLNNSELNSGSDRLYGDDGNDTIGGDDGNDILYGASSTSGGNIVNQDRLLGEAGNDTLYGSDGNDTLLGGDDDDFLRGNAGNDSISGGAGVDVANYIFATGSVEVDLLTNRATGADGNDTLSGIENITGSNHGDTLTGDGAANTIVGSGGNDVINAGGGADSVSAGSGNDRVIMGDASFNGDSYDGGSGIDTFDASARTWGTLVTIDLNAGTWGYHAGDEAVTNFENILGANGTGELLRGNNLDNLIEGNGGNDTLEGLGGNDTLDGGSGSDHLRGGTGNDSVSGGTGNDVLFWDFGTDTLDGGAGQDTIDGDGANFISTAIFDLLSGTYTAPSFSETISNFEHYNNASGTGDERARGSNVANWLSTGSGDNELWGRDGNDTLLGGGGNDTLIGAFTEFGGGTVNMDSLVGGDGTDELFGSDGNDTLDGGAGNDTLTGNAGNDSLIGGAGTDQANYIHALAGVTVNLQTNRSSGSEGVDTLSGIENINGSNHGDVLTGNAGTNLIRGNSGNDTLNDGAGNDIVEGGLGNDHLIVGDSAFSTDQYNGGSGIDTFDVSHFTWVNALSFVAIDLTAQNWSFFGNSEDVIGFENILGANGTGELLRGNTAANLIDGNGGDDTLEGMAGNDTLRGGAGDDSLVGGAGFDTASYAGAASGVTVNLIDGTAVGGAGNDTLSEIENVIGSSHNDALTGNATNNRLEGGDGNDTLDGNGGADTMLGGLGNDVFFWGSGTDSIDGGAGQDTMHGDDVNFGPFGLFDLGNGFYNNGSTFTQNIVNVEHYFNANAGSSDERVFGSDVANDIRTGGGKNFITGLAGNDTIFSGGDDDTVEGGDDDDSIGGGSGDDSLLGGDGVDTLIGGLGDDTLIGGNDGDLIDVSAGGTNRIEAGPGDDTVIATAGRNTIIVGTGADSYSLLGGENRLIFSDAFTGATFNQLGGDDTLDFSAMSQGIVHDSANNLTTLGTGATVSSTGGGSQRTVIGTDHNDVFSLLFIEDDFSAGAGIDTLNLTQINSPNFLLNIDLAGGLMSYTGGPNQISDFENLISDVTADNVTGTAGANTISTGAWNDTVNAGAGDDVVDGGAGRDLLRGGPGNDTLAGGADADTFRYEVGDTGNDLIADLQIGTDKISIDYTGAMPWLNTMGGNTDVNLGGGSTVRLNNVAAEDVTFDLFSFDMAETGTASVSNGNMTVLLGRQFVNPVIFAKTTTSNEAAPVTVRIVDIQSGSFTIRLQEPNAADGVHAAESVTWAVFEAGTWELEDGTRFEVGTLDSNKLSSAGYEDVSFTSGMFDDTPTVLSQVQTNNGADWVISRQRNADADGVQLTMQEEEALNGGGHASETIGWIAFEQASGSWDGRTYEAGATPDSVTESTSNQAFAATFGSAPGLLTSLSRTDGADPASARANNVTSSGFDVFAQEERSANPEVVHTSEAVDFFAIAGSGILSARKAQPIIAEYGTVSADHNAVTVNLTQKYLNPVIFANVTTNTGAAPVTVRLDNIDGDSFDLWLQETSNLDGLHSVESVSWMAVEAGSWQLSDGTVLQAGTLESNSLTSQGFEQVDFGAAHFGTTPTVLSQVQTNIGADWVTTRQQNASSTGVEIAMQEEEAKNNSTHATEKLGWLAWGPGNSSVQDEVIEAGNTGDNVGHANFNQAFTATFGTDPVLLAQLSSFDGADTSSARVKSVSTSNFVVNAQEDTSADAELTHTMETVDYIALNGDGQISGSSFVPVIAAVGSTSLGTASATINFGHEFINPIVFALPPSQNGAQPANVRISNVTSSGFDAAIQEPGNEDGIHITEMVNWVVFEAGNWELSDGTNLSVGSFDSSMLTSAGWESVNFGGTFDAAPAVFSQVQTDNDPAWITTRQRNTTTNSVEISMQEEEATNGGTHGTETIGWFAIDTGLGTWNGNPFEAATTAQTITNNFDTFAFNQSFGNAPKLLASLASYVGPDPTALRYQNLTNTGVDLRAMEETSADAELAHSGEAVSIFGIEADGLLTGYAWDTLA
jgi:Ca2+-binding RTX toxin-like protein